MSQIFEFDVVTAFNASRLNISLEGFKAENPNEFYQVSLPPIQDINNDNALWLTTSDREEIWHG